MTEPYGATPDEWIHVDLILGLTEDILPVVSDPTARISPKSSLKALGKTPSLYNGHDLVIGIPKWTEKRATAVEVEAWAKNDRLGICLQTRRVRAIDIDVPDAALSAEIVAFIESQLGFALPRRFRQGSGKCLLAFELPGDYAKGAMKVEGGIIEFLAGGNQFVVSGAHFNREGPSGTRYEWAGGLPTVVAALRPEQFEALWSALEAAYAVEPSTRLRAVSKGSDLEREDEVAAFLVENWETYGQDREGRRLFVRCPWKDVDHSSDSGETEAAWLMRGAGGFEQGHFRCLHAHCNERGREAFLREVGYDLAAFEVVGGCSDTERGQVSGDEPAGALGRSNLEILHSSYKRNRVTGVIKPTLNNVIMACSCEAECGVRLSYDEFRDELLLAEEGDDVWRTLQDEDAIILRQRLENRDFDPVGRELIRDAILRVAKTNTFDSAKQWLLGLPAWDGVSRIAEFLPKYMGTADTPYTRAVGQYAWSAHAARVLDPGCKADMAIVLVGRQGLLKSMAIAAISPQRDFFAELSLEKLDENLSRQMRGVLVGELAELKGLNSRDSDSIRAWVTKQWESWTPKFREHKTVFKRRLVLWGTSNPSEFLADATGERRWLPCKVGARTDAAAIERDRNQLWAEGLALYRQSGVAWQDAERLARDEHDQFKVVDSWEEHIVRWLHEPALDGSTAVTRGEVTFANLAMAVGLDRAAVKRGDQTRVYDIMRNLGFDTTQKKVDGQNIRVWEQVR